jgi:hypothetical protein
VRWQTQMRHLDETKFSYLEIKPLSVSFSTPGPDAA